MARFSNSGELLSEFVYWPELPISVVADAAAFATKLADTNLASAFKAALPNGGDGQVVIYHTSAFGLASSAWMGRVGYDVLDGHRMKHFVHGTEFRLPHEDGAFVSDSK